MIKKVLVSIFISAMFFMGMSNVSAVTCSDINKEVNNYNAIEKSLSNIDCKQDKDEKIVKKCNKLNLKKSNSITKLYKMKQQNPSCKSAGTKVDEIVKANKGICSKISDGMLEDYTNKFLIIFYILGPILVVLFGSLDYTKAVMSSDRDALRKASRNFFKRIAALILLFLMPTIVGMIININNSEYLISGDSYSCKADYVILKEEVTIDYVPKSSSATTTEEDFGSGGGSATTGGSGDFLSWKQCNSPWSSLTMGTSGTSICKAGCLTTSVAIQIANSKTATGDFDPSVFVKTLNLHGGYSGANFTWTGWQTIAPNFKLENSSASISGTKAQKAKQLANYIKKKLYPVIEVKKCNGGQHWVAVIGVKGSKVTMADPASQSTDLAHYPCFANSGSQRVALFKK